MRKNYFERLPALPPIPPRPLARTYYARADDVSGGRTEMAYPGKNLFPDTLDRARRSRGCVRRGITTRRRGL